MTGASVHPPLQITTTGPVSEADIDEVTSEIEPLLARVDRLSGAHLRLTHVTYPAAEQPAVAEVIIDVAGHVVRARAAAANMAAAARLLQTTLADKLRRASRALGTGHPVPPVTGGEQPHHVVARLGSGRGAEAHVVRHRPVRLARETAREAVLDMELGDYEFFLFVDALTGADCLLERRGPDTFQLFSAGAASCSEPGPGVSVLPADLRPPRIELAEAARRLTDSEAEHLFFVDAATGRGSVLYRRYPGHYALISPAAGVGGAGRGEHGVLGSQ